MIDEEQHPGSERFQRRHGGGEALLGRCEFFNFAAMDGFNERIAGGEMTIERAEADAGQTSDIVKARGSTVAGEDLLRGHQDAFEVALGIGTRLAGGRDDLLFVHAETCGNLSTTGGSLRLSLYSEIVSALFGANGEVKFGATFAGCVPTAGA